MSFRMLSVRAAKKGPAFLPMKYPNRPASSRKFAHLSSSSCFSAKLSSFSAPAFFSAASCSWAQDSGAREGQAERQRHDRQPPHAAFRRRMVSAIWLASDSLSDAIPALAASTSAASCVFASLMAVVGVLSGLGHGSRFALLQLFVQLLLSLIHLGLRRAQLRFVAGGLGSRLFQALRSELSCALGGLVPLLQDLFQWFKEDALQIEVQQDDQQKGRHCSQQYSAQGVQHGIHDFVLGETRRKLLSR